MVIFNQFDIRKEYLQPGEYLKMIDYDGNWTFFRIARAESLGTMQIKYASPDDKPNSVLASGAETGWMQLKFLQPPAENRIYQVRPFLFMEESEYGVMYPYGVYLPAMIKLQWKHPLGTSRGGTDESDDVTINDITQTVGGPGNGYMTPHTVPLESDLNEFFDLWTVYGSYPEVNIINDSPLDLGDESSIPNGSITHDFNHYIGFTGMKYLVINVTEDEYNKLANHQIEYRARTIGGIPIVTTR